MMSFLCASFVRAEQGTKINFHLRPKAPNENSVPDVRVPGRVCVINSQRFQVSANNDEAACVNKGGRVQLTSGETVGLPSVKDATKDTSLNDRMNRMMQPPPNSQGADYDKKVRGVVHYDPLEPSSP